MSDTPPPVSAGDVFGAAGEPATVEYGGTVYRFGPPTGATVTRLEMLVFKRAEDELEELRPLTRPDRFKALDERFNALTIARAHRVGGELYEETMAGPDGTVLFALALLREHHPKVTEAEVRGLVSAEPDRVKRAIILVTPSFIEAVGKKMGQGPDQIKATVGRLMPWLES